MDKYQEYFVKNLIKFLLSKGGIDCITTCEVLNDEIVIKQFDDITITKYYIYVEMEKITYSQEVVFEYDNNGKWELFPEHFKEVVPALPIDFLNQIKKIRITSKLNLFEPIELTLKYVFADKDAYYEKKLAEELDKKQEAQRALNDLIKPDHKTGSNLVNIFWNLVNDNIETVKINLYAQSNNEIRLIGKYKESETMFKSITGLAYGQYLYEIIELDKDGNEVAKTGKINFAINAPYAKAW